MKVRDTKIHTVKQPKVKGIDEKNNDGHFLYFYISSREMYDTTMNCQVEIRSK